MKAVDAFRLSKHRPVRTPAPPQEFRYGDGDRNADARNGAEQGHGDGAEDGKPEFPLLDTINPSELLEFEEPDRSGNDDCRERRIREVFEQLRSSDDNESDDQRPDQASHLRLCAGRCRNRSTARAAADWEAQEEACREVGGAKTDHLLVGIHTPAASRSEGA